jgi:hypothetical protein
MSTSAAATCAASGDPGASTVCSRSGRVPAEHRARAKPERCVTHELVSLIAQYGLLVVALNVLLDQIGLPVPAMTSRASSSARCMPPTLCSSGGSVSVSIGRCAWHGSQSPNSTNSVGRACSPPLSTCVRPRRALEPRWIPRGAPRFSTRRGPSYGVSAEGPGDHSILHAPERSLRRASRQDPGAPWIQASTTAAGRARSQDSGGLRCGDGGQGEFLSEGSLDQVVILRAGFISRKPRRF